MMFFTFYLSGNLVVVVVVVIVVGPSSKRPKALSFQISMRTKFGGNVPQVNMHRLMESYF